MNASRQKKIGPARGEILLTPLEPFAWRRAALEEPGPACLCLRLFPLASPAWLRGGEAIQPEDISRLPAAYAESAADALCAPWLTAGERAELESLEAYLKALADYPGLSCGECRTQEQNGEGPPDCASCPLPRPPDLADVLWEAYRVVRHLPGSAAAGVLTGLTARELRILGHGLEIIDRLAGARGAAHAKIE